MLVRAILLLVGLAAAATVGVNSGGAAVPGDSPPAEAGGDADAARRAWGLYCQAILASSEFLFVR